MQQTVTSDGKVTLTILEKEDSVLVTNYPADIDRTVDVEGTKIWSGGADADHAPLVFYLKKNGVNVPGSDLNYTVTPTAGPSNTFTYKWTGLDKYNIYGAPNVYTVDEKETPIGYEKTVDTTTNTVTNTYNPAIINRIVAYKRWVGGESLTCPTIYFELWRTIGGIDAGEKVPNVDVKELLPGTESVEWLDALPETDSNANPYTYFVKEKLTLDGLPETPENYVNEYPDWTNSPTIIQNTYTPPKTPVTATKTWVNGSTPRPDIWFKLYRSVDGGVTFEGVPDAEAPITILTGGTTSVTWDNISQTDNNGNPYTFKVKEVNSLGESFAPENYEKTETGLSVTNEYISPHIEITAAKSWVNGPEIVPIVGFRLHRYLEGGSPAVDSNDDRVPGLATKFILDRTNTTVNWTVPETNENGVKYVYYVREVCKDDLMYCSPVNWTVSNNNYAYADTIPAWTITNEYQIPTQGVVTANKIWENGPTPRPTTWFKLYRSTDDGLTVEEVPVSEAPIKELPDGTTSVTWTGLSETDINGKEYTFSVKEVDNLGNDFTPENYIKSGEGTLSIYNSYECPRADIRVEKQWTPSFTNYPEINFSLQRRVVGSTDWETDVLFIAKMDGVADSVTEGSSGELEPWLFTWENIFMKNYNGESYEFRVVEDPVPQDFTVSYNSTTDADGVSRLIIENTVNTTTIEGTKTWAGIPAGTTSFPTAKFTLKQNGVAYGEVKNITATGNSAHTFSWTNLPIYDSNAAKYVYTVEEAKIPGYTTTTGGDAATGFTFTNAYDGLGGEEAVAINVKKTWSGIPAGTTSFPTAKFTLKQNGTAHDVVKELTATGNVDQTVSWTDLLKYAPDSSLFVYTVEEAKIPGYTTTTGGDAATGFTFTNAYDGLGGEEAVTVNVKKTWSGIPAGTTSFPTAKFTLKQNDVAHGDVKELVATGNVEQTASWTNLLKYAPDSSLFVYTVEEAKIPGYTTTTGGDAATGFTFTNTYDGLGGEEAVTVNVKKTWSGIPADTTSFPTAKFTLKQNDVAHGDVKELTATGNGDQTASWINLLKYAPDSSLFVYTVEEAKIPGYTTTTGGDAATGFTFTNAYDGLGGEEAVTVNVKKTWSGIPTGTTSFPTAKFTLKQNGTAHDVVKELTATGNGDQTASWTNLLKYAPDSSLFVYTVEEAKIPGYTTTTGGDAATGFTFTNTYDGLGGEEAVTVNVKKTWSGIPADTTSFPTAKFTLKQNDVAHGDVKELTATGNGDQTASWTNLLKYAPDSSLFVYTVEEAKINGYTTTTGGDAATGFTFTNTYDGLGGEDAVEVSVSKTWEGIPAETTSFPTAQFTLKQNGVAHGEVKTLTAIGNGEQTASWVGLLKYAPDSLEFLYTVEEAEIPGYITTSGGDAATGFTFTNTYDGGETSETSFVATKIWENLPEEAVGSDVYLQLMQDGVEYGDSVLLTDDGSHIATYEWESLPKYKQDNSEFVYSVYEPEVSDEYVCSISEDGSTVTNTFIGFTPIPYEKIDVTATKVWKTGPKPRPDIWFKLCRNVEGEEPEPVDVEIIKLSDGETKVTWYDLDNINSEGLEYIYSVKEVDENGNDFAPEGYRKIEEGRIVLNIYEDENDIPEVPADTKLTVVYTECGRVIDTKEFNRGDKLTFDVNVRYNRGYYVAKWVSNGRTVDENTIVYNDMIVEVVWKPLPTVSGDPLSSSIKDVIMLLQYTAKIGPLKDVPESNMIKMGFDLNGDGVINIVDVIIYLKEL